MTQSALPNQDAETEQIELSLTDNFAGVVLKKSGNGGLTVDVSALDGVGLTVITSGGVLQFKAPSIKVRTPTAEQTNHAPAIITASPTIKSFSPDNAIIRAGQVELRKISQYLADLPADATAELLVAPQDLAKIDDQWLGTWVNTIKRIRQIEGYHGLDGMRIFDRTEEAPRVTYEQSWASQIRTAWEQTKRTGQSVTTGLFLGTKELVHGCKIGSSNVTVDTNLYSLRKEIGQKGNGFIATSGTDLAHWQWSCTENPSDPSDVCNVDFEYSDGDWCPKDDLNCLSARPVGLALQP